MGDYFTVRNGGMSTKLDDAHLRDDATWSSDKINKEIENKVVGAGGHTVTGSTINGNIRLDGEEQVVYTHPATTPATEIEEDSNHRFVSNAEKTEWSGKSKVTSSTVNGNVKIDNNETTIYTHPASHPASVITESTDKQFVSQTDKDKWNGMAETDTTTIQVGTTEVKAGKITLIEGTPNVHLSPSVAGSSITISVDDPTLPEVISNHSLLTHLDYASSGHTGFAPSSHDHLISDIDSLSSTLDGKMNIPANAQTGDLLVRNSVGWVRLPIGASGQVLTSQGTNATPIWQTSTGSGTGGSGILSGTTTERPPAGVAGRVYLNTETNLLYRDTGTTWVGINASQIISGYQVFSFSFDQPAEGAESPRMMFVNSMSLNSITILCDYAPMAVCSFEIYKTNLALATTTLVTSISVSTKSTTWNVPVATPVNIEPNDVMFVKLNSANNGLNKVSVMPKLVNR